MGEDFHHDHRDLYRDYDCPFNDDLLRREEFRTLNEIDLFLRGCGRTLDNFPTLPQLNEFDYEEDSDVEANRLIANEMSYDPELLDQVLSSADLMNDDQLSIFNSVIQCVNDGSINDRLFFLDGPGGTGMSFVLEKILARVRSDQQIAVAVATSSKTWSV